MASGAKRFETRSWDTGYRGPLAIHAAKGLGPMWTETFYDLCEREPFRTALFGHSPRPDPDWLPRGAIIAVCDLAETFRCHGTPPPGAPPDEAAFGDFSAGRFMWELHRVQPIKAVPARGKLGLWEIDLEDPRT